MPSPNPNTIEDLLLRMEHASHSIDPDRVCKILKVDIDKLSSANPAGLGLNASVDETLNFLDKQVRNEATKAGLEMTRNTWREKVKNEKSTTEVWSYMLFDMISFMQDINKRMPHLENAIAMRRHIKGDCRKTHLPAGNRTMLNFTEYTCFVLRDLDALLTKLTVPLEVQSASLYILAIVKKFQKRYEFNMSIVSCSSMLLAGALSNHCRLIDGFSPYLVAAALIMLSFNLCKELVEVPALMKYMAPEQIDPSAYMGHVFSFMEILVTAQRFRLFCDDKLMSAYADMKYQYAFKLDGSTYPKFNVPECDHSNCQHKPVSALQRGNNSTNFTISRFRLYMETPPPIGEIRVSQSASVENSKRSRDSIKEPAT